ncbi:MAG: dienelactone hydrolase family protein [Holosporaceae bacterium]|jgi:phospholipase/carboxylesterase|nr:dienelactone hydrolase family protein [Holosporaceae bacterium]
MDEIILGRRTDADKLIFMFHGYGADKDDLRPVGETFARTLPTAEVRIPGGLEECEAGFGRQWFALRGGDVNEWKDAFLKNAPRIMAYIDSVVIEKKLNYQNVILSGFSQGGMVALSFGLQHNALAVVVFSGLLISPPLCLNCSTKVLLTHGAQDDVIPIGTVTLTEEALKTSGISVQTAISQNLAHGIDGYLLSKAVDFLKEL